MPVIQHTCGSDGLFPALGKWVGEFGILWQEVESVYACDNCCHSLFKMNGTRRALTDSSCKFSHGEVALAFPYSSIGWTVTHPKLSWGAVVGRAVQHGQSVSSARRPRNACVREATEGSRLKRETSDWGSGRLVILSWWLFWAGCVVLPLHLLISSFSIQTRLVFLQLP